MEVLQVWFNQLEPSPSTRVQVQVPLGIGLTRAYADLPPSKLTPSSLPEI